MLERVGRALLRMSRPKKHARGFDAAQISRLTDSWTTQSLSADADIYRSLDILRARSRHLCYNNDYAKKFLQMCSTHIVGPNGFDLQMQVKDRFGVLDSMASTAIETAFYAWSKRGVCEMSRKMSFVGLNHLIAKSLPRDGEVLIRKIYGQQANRFGFALQVLDIDRLDLNRNEELRDGNIIKMGVEISPVGEPVAYHLRTKHPGDGTYSTVQGTRYERIPASDIYHLGIPDRPEQTRFLPWMHSAMVRLNNLGGYEEAAVIAARVGASKMGFFQSPDGGGEGLADDIDPATGELYTEATPGQFGVLPTGYSFQGWDPQYPHQNYDVFVKSCLRGIASGLGVAYNTLSNDLEGVNFSSIRTGVLEERDNWMVIQNWFIESFLIDVFETWLKWALVNGQITLPTGGALPISRFDVFNKPVWQGRRWQWVDPLKDVQANVEAINAGLKSRRRVIAEQGLDLDETWTELAAENEKAKTLGISINDSTNQPQPKGAADETQD